MLAERPLAVITGGTSGIGLATAQRLAPDYRLALIYARDQARALAAESSFPPGSQVKTFCVDVADDLSVDAGYAALVAHFGGSPGVLINSAGVARFQRFFVQSRNLDMAQEMMNINYFGSLRMIQKVLPQMYARRRGCIVNLASVSGHGGNAGVIGYAESKAAILCFTQNLAMEVAHRGISLNCVSPGRVDTRMTFELLRQFKKESINFPLGRALTADEVPQTIEFLVRIGPAINGQEIVIDGGTTVAKVQAQKRPTGSLSPG